MTQETSPPSLDSQMRAEFNAWVQDQGCDTDGAWSAWQAAWNRRAAPGGQQDDAPFVRDLLWNEHPECCGQPADGCDRGDLVCCGMFEPAMLNDKQIVATLRARFPDV